MFQDDTLYKLTYLLTYLLTYCLLQPCQTVEKVILDTLEHVRHCDLLVPIEVCRRIFFLPAHEYAVCFRSFFLAYFSADIYCTAKLSLANTVYYGR